MARLLQLSPPSRRVREAVRAWWAVHLQHRRRERAGGAVVVPAPTVTGAMSDWGRTENDWVDFILNWTFDAGALPAGSFEIWRMREAVETEFSLAGTVPSSRREFYDEMVFQTAVFVYYKLRYVSGSIVGPFSEEYGVDS